MGLVGFRGKRDESRSSQSEEIDAPATDEELVARAHDDRQAFAVLYRRYLDPVHRYCYRRLGSRELAEDATGIVFARALAALPTMRGPSFRSWLFAIAHNAIADQLRSRRWDEPLDAAAEVEADDPLPEAVAIAEEERRVIRGLLTQLPPEQRRVVELRLAGLTGPEIREALGRSRAWVDTNQYRAILRLRGMLRLDEPLKGVGDGTR